MHDFFILMWKPLVACLVLAGIHAYLGIHVIERKVIFVDLALAQIAALGAVIASLFHFDLHGPVTYWFSLAATLLGALIFASSRVKNEKIPQEAIIGIVYAVSTALAVLILSHSPEGDEHIRYMLVGNILLVSSHDILVMAALYLGVGIFHWVYRKKFLLISTAPAQAEQMNISLKRWDILFYLSFGVVVTSSVHIAGVLLVFSYLIVPAVVACLTQSSIRGRLVTGWLVGIATSIAGIIISYAFDLPTGATIVASFGGFLLIYLIFYRVRPI